MKVKGNPPEWVREKIEEFYIEEERKRTLHQELDLNYRYFRFKVGDLETSVSVGWKQLVVVSSTDVISHNIQYSIAFQSKNDKFSRRKARECIDDKFYQGFIGSFSFDPTIKQRDLLIACHYNSRACDPVHNYGVSPDLGTIPKHVRFIPIKICTGKHKHNALLST